MALIDLARDRLLTYAELHLRVARAAGYLHQAGVRPGDRVAVLAGTSSDVFEVQFACARVGAIFLPLNWRLAVAELAEVLTDAEPALLFVDAARLAAARASFDPQRIIEIGGGFDSGYERALTAHEPLRTATPRTHDDVQIILYTSGTTGLPKGVQLTFGNIFWTAANLAPPCCIGAASVTLVVMPLFHTSGLNLYANPVFHAGGTVIVLPRFEAGEVLSAVGDATLGITHFFAVPAAWAALADHAQFQTTDLSRIVVAGVGGAPTPIALLDRFAARGLQLFNGFGMTEGTTVSALFADDARRKIGSVGTPFLHAEVGVFRADGTQAAPREIAELRFRGPFVTPGYWRKPTLNADLFVDGWLRSGDLAYTDEDGFLFIVDRSKDMYISGGENVYPAEIERVLHEMPEIAEAAVIGAADPRWGESGIAVVALRSGSSLDEAAILAHCAARLARYKLPSRVAFIPSLPRTAAGKVHKPTLRAQFAAERP